MKIGTECTLVLRLIDLRTETADAAIVVDQLSCDAVEIKRALLTIPARL